MSAEVRMRPGASRRLSEAEKARLSPGLARAMDAAKVSAWIVNRVHPGARVAAVWRGAPPILARPDRLHWPGALADFSDAPPEVFATLQHELQHLLDYATGALTGAGYLLRPRNWRYAYEITPGRRWGDFGAEQRASIAEHLWLLEQARADLVRRALGADPAPLDRYRALAPWAGAPHPAVP